MTKPFYIHQDHEVQSFTQLPKFLFEALSYKPLSTEAKLLYVFILRRTDLYHKNGWADEYGRIYLYYPIIMHRGKYINANINRSIKSLKDKGYITKVDINKNNYFKVFKRI